MLQAIQNEREIESLRKKLAFCLEAKEDLERYNYFPTFDSALNGLSCFIIKIFTSSIVYCDIIDFGALWLLFHLISTMFPFIHSYSCASTTLPAILVVQDLHGHVN